MTGDRRPKTGDGHFAAPVFGQQSLVVEVSVRSENA